MRSISSSVKYSVFAAAKSEIASDAVRMTLRLTFARWGIFFSEQRLQQIFPDFGGHFFGFFDGISLIEGYSAGKIIEHPALLSQGDFEILESLGFPVRVASGLNHCLVRVPD